MNIQILSNFVLFASVMLLVCSILSFGISLIAIRKKQREEFILNHRITLNGKILRNATEDEKDALATNSEVMKMLIEIASKNNEVRIEPNIFYKGRKRRFRRNTDFVYMRGSELMLYYWLKKMEFTNKRIENLNMSIMECDLKIREAKTDKIG